MIERPSQDVVGRLQQPSYPLPPARVRDADEVASKDNHAVSSTTAEFACPGRLIKRGPYVLRANFDRLTGLRGRAELREKLQDSARFAKILSQSSVLILVDLDDFRNVNATYGQEVGDACLQQVARHLVSAVGEIGFIARIGEDEFAIFLQGYTSRSICFILKRIKEAIFQQLCHERLTLRLTGSIGIAVRRDGESYNPDELLRDAALALNEAKLAGKNCHRAFRRAHLADFREKSETLRDMQRALAAGEFELYYQPKIALEDRAHKGFEALLRWKKPDGRILTPGCFMSAFQNPSLSMDIGNYVIASAIAQARQWVKARVPFASIAVNLSSSQFRDAQLGHRILSAIAANDLDPARFEVEVTEEVFLSTKEDAVMHACKVLKQGGVKIAFDDFGTGFASLAHLRDFPVDTLKIDRSFIDQIGQVHNTTVIVNAMVDMAHNLSINVVAEGVETQAQADFLRAIKCDTAQGYFFGRPAPAALATRHLEFLDGFNRLDRIEVAAGVE